MYFPASHFYIPNRNTIQVNNHTTDFLEESFAQFDNRHSPLLRKLQQTDNPINLTVDELGLLKEFIAYIFWRLPSNDNLFLEEYRNNPDFYKSFKIVNKKTQEKTTDGESLKLLQSDAFIQSTRSFVGIVTLLTSDFSDGDLWNISYANRSWKLISDSPFVFREIFHKHVLKSEFFLPLTQNHLLYKSGKQISIQYLKPEITLMVDTIVLKQANYFCVCSRKDYLTTIVNISSKFTIEQLKNKVFNYLDSSE